MNTNHRKILFIAGISVLATVAIIGFLSVSDRNDQRPIMTQDTTLINEKSTCACSHSSKELQKAHVIDDTTQDVPLPDINKKGKDNISLVDLREGPFRTQFVALPNDLQAKVLRKIEKHPVILDDLDSLRLTSNGQMFYVCSFGKQESGMPQRSATQEGAEIAYAAAGASVSINSPPIRHSRPGASNVLFLDFNGHFITNTAWNLYYGGTTWDCRPYDIDGDEGTFSSQEQADIIEIWERVAEDYAPFNVDVTTEQPASWNRYTGHLLITPGIDKDGKICPHNGYGGLAFVDPFGEEDYSYNVDNCASPAWVTVYNTTIDSFAEAASHEAGHNMGLYHDGTSGEEYYPGHENGQISWGAIMGAGYGRHITQWSRGQYYDSDNWEDDLSIIAGKLSYRPDDYGNDNSSASLLSTLASGQIQQNGLIERVNDPDVFTFSFDGGVITIMANPYQASANPWGCNLDIELKLYNDSGTLIASDNPVDLASASISILAPAGTYYLHVKPVIGLGNPTAPAPSGYTSYGNLGQYFITGSISIDMDFDGIANDWENQYFGSMTGAVATADTDGDGIDNLTEYISGSDPTNASSIFTISNYTAPTTTNAPFIITWDPAVSGRVYNVEWSSNLTAPTPFSDISGDLPYPTSSYTDSVQRVGQGHFYKISVRVQ